MFNIRKKYRTRVKRVILTDQFRNFSRKRYETDAQSLGEIYKDIQHVDEGEDGVNLFFQMQNQEGVRAINIPAEYLETIEDFRDRVESIQRGDVEGSDKFSKTFELISGIFDIVKYEADVNANFINPLFKNLIEDTKNNKCFDTVFNALNKHYKTNLKIPKIKDVQSIINNFEGVNVISNDIIINNIKFNNRTQKIPLKDKYELFYIKKTSGSAPYVIYSPRDNHVALSLDKPEILSNLFIRYNKDIVIKQEEKYITYYKKNNLYKTKKALKKYQKEEVYFIFYDIETVCDFKRSNVAIPYSVDMLCIKEDELSGLDCRNPEKYIKDNGIIFNHFTGFKCMEGLIKFIENHQKDKIFKLVSWNGSNFDNFLLHEAYLNSYEKKVSGELYVGTSLLDFKINYRHSMFDLCRHINKPLKVACEDFNLGHLSKGEFDHHEAQVLYDNNQIEKKLDTKYEFGRKLAKYNKYDVISMAIIYKRYEESLKEIVYNGTPILDKPLHEYITIGSMAWSFTTRTSEIKINELPELTIKQYQDLKKYSVAGRVELFNGVCSFIEPLCSKDVTSLYPYIMAIYKAVFGSGKIIDFEKDVPEDTVYFAYCDLDQSNLIKQNLPCIYANKTKTSNDWKAPKLKNVLLSSPIIKLAKKYGCKVNIKKGFYFTEKFKNYKMFGCVLELMKGKMAQDQLKNKKSEKYNNCLREIYKLISNSISGKTIEGLHDVKIENVSENKYLKLKNSEKITKLNVIKINKKSVTIQYKKNIESLIKRQKPIWIGCLIYDYAKIYMYEQIYSKLGKSNCIYTDTDACKSTKHNMDKWINSYASKKIIPHWKYIEKIEPKYKTQKLYQNDSKLYGAFEEELNPNNKGGYFLQKKLWLVKDGKSKDQNKLGSKGIPIKSIILTKKEYDTLGKTNQRSLYDYFNNKTNQKKSMSISNNQLKFFSNLNQYKKAYILCFSMKKNVKNLKKSGIKDKLKHNSLSGSIQPTYVLKQIKLA